jgi:hypothetical protein
VNNNQPLHHKNIMAVVHPLSKIISILLTLCSEWPSESHLAPRNGVLYDRVLLMLQHHSHIRQKWLFHFEICLQNYEKRLLALSCVIRSVCLLSVCTEQLGPTEQIVIKFYTGVLFVKKIQVSLKSDKNNGYFT